MQGGGGDEGRRGGVIADAVITKFEIVTRAGASEHGRSFSLGGNEQRGVGQLGGANFGWYCGGPLKRGLDVQVAFSFAPLFEERRVKAIVMPGSGCELFASVRRGNVSRWSTSNRAIWR